MNGCVFRVEFYKVIVFSIETNYLVYLAQKKENIEVMYTMMLYLEFFILHSHYMLFLEKLLLTVLIAVQCNNSQRLIMFKRVFFYKLLKTLINGKGQLFTASINA